MVDAPGGGWGASRRLHRKVERSALKIKISPVEWERAKVFISSTALLRSGVFFWQCYKKIKIL